MYTVYGPSLFLLLIAAGLATYVARLPTARSNQRYPQILINREVLF